MATAMTDGDGVTDGDGEGGGCSWHGRRRRPGRRSRHRAEEAGVAEQQREHEDQDEGRHDQCNPDARDRVVDKVGLLGWAAASCRWAQSSRPIMQARPSLRGECLARQRVRGLVVAGLGQEFGPVAQNRRRMPGLFRSRAMSAANRTFGRPTRVIESAWARAR